MRSMRRTASEALTEISNAQLYVEVGRVIERLTQVPDYPGAKPRSERAAFHAWSVLREAVKRGLAEYRGPEVGKGPGVWVIPDVGTLYEGPCRWEYAIGGEPTAEEEEAE